VAIVAHGADSKGFKIYRTENTGQKEIQK